MKNQEVKKSMETKENESGRSMVETLGVLAVMGVLSIGGVAGYRWAMGKYNTDPGLVTEPLMFCEDACRIKTEECEGDNPTGFKLNNGICIRCSCSCMLNNNARQDNSTSQGNCSVCDGQNGRDKRYYMNGYCHHQACPTGSTANEATQTCVPESGYLCDVEGPCYSCSYSDYVSVGRSDEGKAMCLSCDGTNGTTKRYYMNGYCYQTCPAGSTANEATQECVPESGYLCDADGFCSCSDSNLSQYIGTSSEAQSYCASCDGTDGKTQRFYGTDGYCYSCSYPDAVSSKSGQAACHSCNTGGNKRYYSNGWCYPCPTSLDLRLIALRTQEKCEQCGGAWDGSKCS